MRPLHHSSESGQALVFATLSITVLFGALGLAVDLGFSYSVKQRLQTAADAAAGAAAKYALDNSDSCGTGGTITCPATLICSKIQTPGNSLQAGCDYGLTGAPSGMTLSLTENTGGLTGNSAKVWIQATATISSPIFFVSSKSTTATIKAQATAGITAFAGAGCIYVLDKTASPALYASGNTTVSASDCGIYVASSAANAIDVEGSSTVNATGGGEVVIECGACYYTSGTSTAYYVSGGSHVPPAVGATNDPLATLQGPSWTASGCTQNPNYTSGGSTYSLTSGVYCGGITIGGNNTVNLGSGTYILDGGGFTVTNSAKVNGTGVTIYITSDASHPAAGLNLIGNATVNLTAPTSGTYQGIVFFQDKAVTSAATIGNSANGTITGTYYLPSAAFSLTGDVGGTTTAAFIVDTLTVNGSSTLNNDPTGKVTGLNKSYAGLLQ
jgi:hypothetical protein